MATVVVRGLDARQGETAFAFGVLRMRESIGRAGLIELVRYISPLVADADEFLGGMPDALEEPVRFVAIPWTPPEPGSALDAQRKLIEGAWVAGVEAAWFFQTGTALPSPHEANEDDLDPDDRDEAAPREPLPLVDPADSEWREAPWSTDEVTGARAMPLATFGDPDEGDDDLATTQERRTPARAVHVDDFDPDDDAEHLEGDGSWSHGPPPQVLHVRFPVDGYPAILEELDWEDFGIAFKLAGSELSGENTVLLGFHALWLAPYTTRYRNCAVTFDRVRHAAHLWVDRFAVPCSPEEQVHHLLWILSKIDEVIPVVHARFAGATMAQKYGGLLPETDAPFVLGGNPLLAAYAGGGEQAVDRWIATQQEWTKEEVAQMLREVAIDIVTTGRGERADAPGHGDDGEIDDEIDEDSAPTAGGDDDEEDDSRGSADEGHGRHIAAHATELLRSRALAGVLDPRVADTLVPVLAIPDKYEHRRRAVVEIFGAMRYRAAVPELIRILEQTPIKNALDSIGKGDLLASTAAALGAIGNPSAVAVLAKVVTAPGAHNDDPRAAAADALASCLAAMPEPRDVDDAVLQVLLQTIADRNDGEVNAAAHFAYGRLAQQFTPTRRASARQMLADCDSARDDTMTVLARHAALALASDGSRSATPQELRALLHQVLTSLDYDHEYTVRSLRVALRIAEILPGLINPGDLIWLTRFAEADMRSRAHALLDKLGHPMRRAAVFGPATARELDDAQLVRWIGDLHVVGRAALVAEAGRRGLETARPAIVNACHEVISNARRGSANLLDPESQLLEAAIKALRKGPLDRDVVALFDRMLRSHNFHVKWELLLDPPKDDRLIDGMFCVLAEKWGWQEETARQWLAGFQGTAAYELARRGAPISIVREDGGEREGDASDLDEADQADEDDEEDELDDDQVN